MVSICCNRDNSIAIFAPSFILFDDFVHMNGAWIDPYAPLSETCRTAAIMFRSQLRSLMGLNRCIIFESPEIFYFLTRKNVLELDPHEL
jgi:hypothetical protein